LDLVVVREVTVPTQSEDEQQAIGTVFICLFDNVAPLTAGNFCELCTAMVRSKFFTNDSDVFTGINILTVPVGGYVLYTIQKFISFGKGGHIHNEYDACLKCARFRCRIPQ
jgi:cyclophilin family peptidyl-prolyl cis-trans isomerase